MVITSKKISNSVNISIGKHKIEESEMKYLGIVFDNILRSQLAVNYLMTSKG